MYATLPDFVKKKASSCFLWLLILGIVSSFVFAVVFGAIFGGFLPCVGFSIEGWDTHPTPEKKRAHRGNSGEHRSTGSFRSTMQMPPMVIFLLCKDARIYNAERTDCNVAIFIR